MKYYIGVDYCREYSYISIIDSHANVVREGRIANTKKALNQFLDKYSKNSSAALEAGRNRIMHDWLKEILKDVKLVHPSKIHALSRDETMSLTTDAEILEIYFVAIVFLRHMPLIKIPGPMRPNPIRPDRIRTIPKSFSFVDHKFITSGYINLLSKEEIILYYFLTTVGDRNGISYYHQDTICRLLKLDLASFTKARDHLIFKDLIDYRNGIYQVLSLPDI